MRPSQFKPGATRLDIFVCVKQVLDARMPLEVTPEGLVVQRGCPATFILNPADHCALQEALRIRAQDAGSRVIVITVGPKRAQSTLSVCLAAGADSAIHILSEDSLAIDPFCVARALSVELGKRAFDLILCGDRTLDDGASEVGPVLAELLGIPQVTGVVKLTFSKEKASVIGERKQERGYRQAVSVRLPVLVAVNSSICQPRYVTTRAQRYAAKTIDEHCTTVPFDLSTSIDHPSPLRKVLRLSPPRPRAKKIAQIDSGMATEDRIAQMLGLTAPVKQGKGVSGDPEQLADDIVAFLSDKGLV